MITENTIKQEFFETQHSNHYGELRKINVVFCFEVISDSNRFSIAYCGFQLLSAVHTQRDLL